MFESFIRRPSKPVRTLKRKLNLVSLEARDVAATFSVINTNDAGIGSLRQAVLNANAAAGADTINFSANFNTSKIINLTSGMIAISEAVHIDGTGSNLLTVNSTTSDRIFSFNSALPAQQQLTLDGIRLINGDADGFKGGAIFVASEKLVASDVHFLDNQGHYGGAVYGDSGSSLLFTDCEFDGNTGAFGGAVYAESNSIVSLTNSIVRNNKVSAFGGGINVQSGSTLVVIGSTIASNSADNGGGISATGTNLTVMDSLISANTAGPIGDGSGGGVDIGTLASANIITFRNSTISGNRALGNQGGGGLDLNTDGNDPILIENCTITGNSSADEGGGINVGTTPNLRIESSIIAGNSAGNGSHEFNSTAGIDLKSSAVGSSNAGFDNLGGNFFGATPASLKLGPLISNGGPRQSHAISFGSPLQDQGTNPGNSTTDVRGAGFLRDFGGVDIGAYEIQSSTNVTNTNDSGPGSLRQAVLTSNSMIGGNTITFSSLFDTPRTITLTGGDLEITEGVTIDGPGAERLTVRSNTMDRVITFDSAFPAMQTLNLNGLTIADGKGAGTFGGGVRVEGERLTAIGVRFVNNKASNIGGAVYGANGSILTFRDCEFTGNQGTSGGAVNAQGNCILTFLNTSLIDNTASSQIGGAITTGTGSSINVTGCTLEGNSAAGNGGAIYLSGTATAIVDSLIANNTGGNYGGGIMVAATISTGSFAIRNSTLSGNSAVNAGFGGGGAIRFSTDLDDPITIDNCTITDNSSVDSADGVSIGIDATVAITSSLIVGNGFDLASLSPIDLKASAIGTTGGVTFNDLGGNFLSATIASVKLGALADNGGLRFSHALAADSPLLNKGTNPNGSAIDSRGAGFPRDVNGGADIGSYERQASFVVTNSNDAGPGSLRQALADADTSANTNDFVTFDPVFFSTPRVITLNSGISVLDGVDIVGPGAKFVTITNPNQRALRLNTDGQTNGDQEFSLSGVTIADSGSNIGDGGGLFVQYGDFTIRDCDFTGNKGNGAAIGGFEANLVVDNSNFTGNTANQNLLAGGAIRIVGDLVVRGSTFSGNTSVGPGGAINFTGAGSDNLGNVRIENSTFHQNGSTTQGGAIAQESQVGKVSIFNSTITGNSADEGGGLSGGVIELVSSVVTQNGAISLGDDIFDAEFSSKNSLWTDTADVVYANLGGNLPQFTNPMLGALAFNGGTTKTRAPLAGSPLINAGINSSGLSRDQRGLNYLRMFGTGTDIGAVEVQAPPVVTGLTVDDGSGHHSVVRSITVNFNCVVNIAPGAFDVVRTGPTGATGPVPFTVDTSLSTPQNTIAKLTFTADPTFTQFGSLIDGTYRAVAIASKITDGSGQQLDGNSNGTGGDSAILFFHRLFGDLNGDQTVSGDDFAIFGNNFNNSYFACDFNTDGNVDGNDLTQFGNRFGVTL